jgi:ADP-heptose:LPS heptosyltransferase
MTAAQRILLCRPDRIGDVILSTACIEPLRAAQPHAKLYLLVPALLRPLLAGHPLLDGVEGLPDAGLDDVERLRTLETRIRDLGIDTLIQLHPDPVVERAAWQASVTRRVGFRKYDRRWLTDALPLRKHRGEKHEARHAFDLLARIGVAAPPDPLRASLHVDPGAREAALAKLDERTRERGYAALHLGAHGRKPRLPEHCFAAAAAWLIDQHDLDIVLIGAEPGDPSVSMFMDLAGERRNRVIDLSGGTTLAEAAWLLGGARVFLSRDTGPAHLAAAMGCPTVTVFAEPGAMMSSRRWRPLGPSTYVVEQPARRRWFETRRRHALRHAASFEPGAVIAALREALGERGNR